MILGGDDHVNEIKEEKLKVTRHKKIFKVVQSEYFSYVYYYSISFNYEKGITHSVSNLAEFWQGEKKKRRRSLVMGGFALFIDPYDHYLILNFIISYLIKGF